MPLPSFSSSSRKLDIENTPPSAKPASAKSKVRGGIQGAARRRRARSAGGPHHPRYAVEQAKHKKNTRSQPSLINVDLPRTSTDPDVVVPDTTSAVTMATFYLPRYLLRPVFRSVTKEAIVSVAPELADTALGYIREGLQFLGPYMMKVLSYIRADPASDMLPKDIPVIVDDISSDMPTHMLAVYSRDVPSATKRRVTLYPIHHIILATHCANLPVLERSEVARPDTPGSTITIPILPLCIPAPDVFPHLSTFLYTKRVDHLLATVLPCPVPPLLYLGDPTSERVLGLLQQFAGRLATSYSGQTLLTHAMTINGLWRNACALGIDDEGLWCALDVAWEVLLHAICISSGKQL